MYLAKVGLSLVSYVSGAESSNAFSKALRTNFEIKIVQLISSTDYRFFLLTSPKCIAKWFTTWSNIIDTNQTFRVRLLEKTLLWLRAFSAHLNGFSRINARYGAQLSCHHSDTTLWRRIKLSPKSPVGSFIPRSR